MTKYILRLNDGRRFPCKILKRCPQAKLVHVLVKELAINSAAYGWRRWVDENRVEEVKR